MHPIAPPIAFPNKAGETMYLKLPSGLPAINGAGKGRTVHVVPNAGRQGMMDSPISLIRRRTASGTSLQDIAIGIVPENIVKAFSHGNMPAIRGDRRRSTRIP